MNPQSFIRDAVERVPPALRSRAVEVGYPGPAAAELGCKFARIDRISPPALGDEPMASCDFLLALRAFDGMGSMSPVVSCLRDAARLLKENGVLCANLNNSPSSATRFSTGEMVELARDLDFQILAMEAAGSKSAMLLWRKRAPGWRADLAGQAALATARIRRVRNAFNGEPLTPNRGPYAAISIAVEGLPGDADLFDLEVTIGGTRATATSIGGANTVGWQEIRVTLPALENTGLMAVELGWFGERIAAEPALLRVIPAGPVVPRMAGGATVSARRVELSIEELNRPDELSATINGQQVWGLEAFCADPVAQAYDVRFLLPDELAAGRHEVQVMAGKRRLAPVMLEVA